MANLTNEMGTYLSPYLQETFTHTKVFGMSWILSSILIILLLLIVSRDFQRWKSFALPMCVIVQLSGLQVSIVIYIIAGMLFAIDLLSLEVSGNIMKGITNAVKTGAEKTNKTFNKTLMGQTIAADKLRELDVKKQRLKNIKNTMKKEWNINAEKDFSKTALLDNNKKENKQIIRGTTFSQMDAIENAKTVKKLRQESENKATMIKQFDTYVRQLMYNENLTPQEARIKAGELIKKKKKQ